MATIGFLRRRTSFIKKSCILILMIGLVIYLLVPLVFRLSTKLENHFVFVNDVEVPNSVVFDDPSMEGVVGGINRYIKTDGVTLGVWQILPISLVSSMPAVPTIARNSWFLEQLADGKPVFLYCHGNTPSRATNHRIMIYDILQAQDYHVITFDYRGYADSSKIIPTEGGVINDTLNIIQWIKLHTDAPLFVYAHSLGTAISTHALSHLCQQNRCPKALILQSPFTSVADEMRTSYATAPYRFLPWFDYMFIQPLKKAGIFFDSLHNILSVKCPVMILHAQDDIIVPYVLGEKLYKTAKKNRNKSYGMLKFVPFDAKLGYGHNHIFRSPLLPKLIRDFVEVGMDFNANK